MADTVTISRKEYDLLVNAREDLEDLRAYDHARAALDSGEDELVPAEYAKRLVAGESPLRIYRKFRGLTQQALADAAHVNRVQIADIEAGRNSGSVATVRKLADALRVAIDDLV